MQRFALIDGGGLVQNVILWDGCDDWSPPEGMIAIASDVAEIGGSYLDGEFSAPEPEPE